VKSSICYKPGLIWVTDPAAKKIVGQSIDQKYVKYI
jgi:hypothetical protein